MIKNYKKTFELTNYFIFISGFAYFIFKYFLKVTNQFGAVPHKFTPTLLHLHLLTVPVLIIAFGALWSNHIQPMLEAKNPLKKKSGITLVILFLLMTFSGYLIQFGFSLDSTKVIAILHLVVSAFWIVLFIWHRRN